MTHEEKLKKLIKEKKGLILTKDAEERGIPRKYLSLYKKRGVWKELPMGCI